MLEKNEPRSAVLLWAFFTVQSVHLRAPIECTVSICKGGEGSCYIILGMQFLMASPFSAFASLQTKTEAHNLLKLFLKENYKLMLFHIPIYKHTRLKIFLAKNE